MSKRNHIYTIHVFLYHIYSEGPQVLTHYSVRYLYVCEQIIASELFSHEYELVFFVGDYFKNIPNLPKIPFLNEVIIRFGVSNPKEHYHVPLLVSPWSYSTYRGSQWPRTQLGLSILKRLQKFEIQIPMKHCSITLGQN